MRCGAKGTNRLLSGNAGRRRVGSHHLRERGGVSADAGLRRRRMTKGHRIAAQPRMPRQSCDPISVAIRSRSVSVDGRLALCAYVTGRDSVMSPILRQSRRRFDRRFICPGAVPQVKD